MKRFRDFIDQDDDTQHLDEGLISGVAFERRLKGLSKQVAATNDNGQKLDLIAKMIAVGVGALLLNLNKKR